MRVQAPTSIGGRASGRVAGIASAEVGGFGAASIADGGAGGGASGGGGGGAGGGASACATVPAGGGGASAACARAVVTPASIIMPSANPAPPRGDPHVIRPLRFADPFILGPPFCLVVSCGPTISKRC